ncbi:hypothetical protein EDM53_02360 [Rickettsiales endosymbiont of Peranema trichophorum]|uniref:hypothetical protein n=1 Tax=Rickettsiales endosymbiont of Peranema trichophorum TaxID=2486577 RepID=UPI001023A4E0|nr:hypothetical protein [Rickettsiales endosymbiont of Peranema trichophorum]RZI47361.1 hypothetical protein EDM53_02360 [Rickettsiales endosymbiont of Peranema trichophorum]
MDACFHVHEKGEMGMTKKGSVSDKGGNRSGKRGVVMTEEGATKGVSEGPRKMPEGQRRVRMTKKGSGNPFYCY